MPFDRWLYGWRVRLRTLLDRDRADRELDDELRHHVALETEVRRARGVPAGGGAPADARDPRRSRVDPEPRSRGAVRRGAGAPAAGRPLRVPHPRAEPRLDGGGDGHPGPGHRRQRRDVQRAELGAAPVAPLPVAGRARHAVDGDAGPGSSRGQVGVLERRGVAPPEPELRGPRGVRRRVGDPDPCRRDPAGSRGQGLAQSVSPARHRAAARAQLLCRRGDGAAACRGHQPSLLAGAVRGLARRARRVRRSRRAGIPRRRHPARAVPVREPRCRRLRAAHAVSRLGGPPPRPRTGLVVRGRAAAAGRHRRRSAGGDEHDRRSPRRADAGDGTEPGRSGRSPEPPRGRGAVPARVVDAGGGGGGACC